jgi:uncharacterized protein (TIGR03382 family)
MALALAAAIPLALTALVLIIVRRALGARVTSIAVVTLGLLIVALGPLGKARGHAVVDRAVGGGSIDPEQRERIRRKGYEEVDQCTAVGLAMGAPAALVGGVLLVGAQLRRRRA